MKLVQCPNGHFFNEEKTPVCPVCGAGRNAAGAVAPAAAPENRFGVFTTSEMKTEPMACDEDDERTVPLFDDDGRDDAPTVGLEIGGEEWSPVVGWLVCTEGKSRGRDYRIHPERNFIGRSGDMDISVYEDDTIAMREHCSIVYEPLSGSFMLVPGSEFSTFYNGSLLTGFTELSEGDRIKIGSSTFVFVPYCKGDVKW